MLLTPPNTYYALSKHKKKVCNDDDYESRASNDNHNVMLLVMVKLSYNKDTTYNHHVRTTKVL